MYNQAEYSAGSPFIPKHLIAGAGAYTTRKVTLVSGQNVTAGAVLGKITTGGKYTLSLSAAEDGSQTPDMIAAHDCDASGGDKEMLVFETADSLAATALTIGTGHTLASIREGLRVKGLLIDD